MNPLHPFLLGSAFLALATGSLTAKPNVLLITVDDMNWDTPNSFGGTVEDLTPHIDRLASEGMRFTKAHVTVAVCQPCRQVLMTGRYPHRNGALGFSPIDESVPTLQESLTEAGYLNGILGKVAHLQPVHKYNWSYQKNRTEMGYGRDAEVYYRETRTFLRMAEKEEKPFFLMANSHDPHRPFHGSSHEQRHFGDNLSEVKEPSRVYSPEEVEVPGFLPDLPEIRREIAQYTSSAKRADDTVGAILKALADSGHADDTLVMFLSDNGMAFATAKWNTYLQSTRTPWIVRWPGVVDPGSVERSHFISGIDFMPTILDALDLDTPAGMDGDTFLPLLHGERQQGRDSVITAHYQWIHYYGNKTKRKDILEDMVRNKGWRYKDAWGGLIKDMPIRCLRNARYGYIYNEWSNGEDEYIFGYNLTAGALKRAARSDPEIAERLDFIRYRLPEEFYDFEEDPFALNNLIEDPAHQEQITAMRNRLLGWMERTDDPVLPAFKKQIEGYPDQ